MGFLKKIGKAIKKVGKQVGKVVNSHVDLLTGGQFSKLTKANSYFEGHQDKLLAGTLAALAAAGGLAAVGGAGSLFGGAAAAEAAEAGAAEEALSGAGGLAPINSAEAAAGTAGTAGILGTLMSGVVDNAPSYLGSLLNAGLGLGANYLTAQDQLSNQLKLQDRAFQYNTQMWNEQNAYNSPVAQMQRYKDAGLNPMLIYGNGVSSAGNASGAPHYEAPTYKGIDMNSILSFQSMANLMQQNELLQRQTQLAEAQTVSTGINTELNHEFGPLLKLAELGQIGATTDRINAETDQIYGGDNLSWDKWIRKLARRYSGKIVKWFGDTQDFLTPRLVGGKNRKSVVFVDPSKIDLLGL